MSTKSKIDTLRDRDFGFGGLPDTIRIPPLGPRRDEIVKPLEDATVDDVAFAILGLDAEFDAYSSRLHALRKLHTLARENGAIGADRILDGVPVAKGDR